MTANGSATISDGEDKTTTITVPETGGFITPDENGGTNLHGGSSVDSIAVAESSPATRPTDPTRDGYTFTSWYQDVACPVAGDFATMTVTGDTTLHTG